MTPSKSTFGQVKTYDRSACNVPQSREREAGPHVSVSARVMLTRWAFAAQTSVVVRGRMVGAERGRGPEEDREQMRCDAMRV